MFIRNGNWSTNQGKVETKSGVHFCPNETRNAHTPHEFSDGVVVVLTEIRFHLNSLLLPQTPRWASHFGRHTLAGPAKRATATSGITREWRMPVLSLVPFDSFGSCLRSSVRSFMSWGKGRRWQWEWQTDCQQCVSFRQESEKKHASQLSPSVPILLGETRTFRRRKPKTLSCFTAFFFVGVSLILTFFLVWIEENVWRQLESFQTWLLIEWRHHFIYWLDKKKKKCQLHILSTRVVSAGRSVKGYIGAGVVDDGTSWRCLLAYLVASLSPCCWIQDGLSWQPSRASAGARLGCSFRLWYYKEPPLILSVKGNPSSESICLQHPYRVPILGSTATSSTSLYSFLSSALSFRSDGGRRRQWEKALESWQLFGNYPSRFFLLIHKQKRLIRFLFPDVTRLFSLFFSSAFLCKATSCVSCSPLSSFFLFIIKSLLYFFFEFSLQSPTISSFAHPLASVAIVSVAPAVASIFPSRARNSIGCVELRSLDM